ncbi:hypothetical protein F4820DRAFT_427571 [Hypoxylon rubiginosum]|uniref:Uncharacterized protein n=1 Tax=Hypoxylon rubiginosum TaxID=110542 RepID=A0ACB9YV59_9PEZI|nr:hypothetical protein F4820DRAFT_427571 [Hypoxylon rubiginosum]
MIPNFSILQFLLASICLAPVTLGQAQDNQVAWLRNAQDNVAVSDMKVERLADALQETRRAITADENVVALLTVPSEKRDPKRKPSSGNNNSTSTDDDSGAGTTDMSLSLSIGISLAIMALHV